MRWAGLVIMLAVIGCGGGDGEATSSVAPAGESTSSTVTTTATTEVVFQCPEVVDADLSETDPGVFTVSATVRSVDVPDVSYADAWEVRAADGTVLGVRELLHPHVNEQPFTRSLPGVAIPADIEVVEVIARDSVQGFCGAAFTVEVPHS